jgi:1-acyl-sn-glycerol-3-phosphate acyltransferase
MNRVRELLRSFFLWFLSWLHFLVCVPVLIGLGVVLDPRKHDWLQRGLCRRIAFLSGAKVVVKKSSGFDPQRTSFFMVNHVNLLDPFMLYCAIPQLVRGWELESHFRIPIYGWLMKRFGNVPVPNVRNPKDLKRLWRMTQDAINGGTSLIVFPEGKRTRDGHVNDFEEGGFRLAQQLGVPIVPFITCVQKTGSSGPRRSRSTCTTPSKPRLLGRKTCPHSKPA